MAYGMQYMQLNSYCRYWCHGNLYFVLRSCYLAAPTLSLLHGIVAAYVGNPSNLSPANHFDGISIPGRSYQAREEYTTW